MNKWIIIYEKYSKAVEKIYATVQAYLDYSLICTENASAEMLAQSNYIEMKTDKSLEGFKIKVDVSEYNTENQYILISGADDINLLYAASDFANKYLPYAKNSDAHNEPAYYFYELFKTPMKEYDAEFTPRIKRRGLWTWGFVIYDYKKYIDTMVALKLNTLIIWNDFLPKNSQDIIAYAHENGVKIYYGCSWGWDNILGEKDISDIPRLCKDVMETFEKDYADAGCDGIYFQSFTEVENEKLNGISIAETVTDFVNTMTEQILSKYENTELLFGLHATSVKNKLDIIAGVDSRISIIWEDCGAFPYKYIPKDTENFGEALRFTEKIRDLRDGGFGVVLKGLTCLYWSGFEHQKGEFILGVQDKAFLERKAAQKRDIWRYVQAYWIKNAKYAYDMINMFDENSMVTALAEDGVIENGIPYPLALLAEMLWDSTRPLDEIMCETALRPDVDFA